MPAGSLKAYSPVAAFVGTYRSLTKHARVLSLRRKMKFLETNGHRRDSPISRHAARLRPSGVNRTLVRLDH
jgi:hypothetical protein